MTLFEKERIREAFRGFFLQVSNVDMWHCTPSSLLFILVILIELLKFPAAESQGLEGVYHPVIISVMHVSA